MKICKKCSIEKELDQFYNSKNYKDKKESCCKECKLKISSENYYKKPEIRKNYIENNKEKIKQDLKDYFIKNPEYIKNSYLKNKDRNLKYNKEYYYNNLEYFSKEERKLYKREWSKNNRDIINNWTRNEYKTNPLFKLSNLIRSSISGSLKKRNYNKFLKTKDILGCTFEEFKLHLESKFEPWMTWENHGKYNGESNFGWDIDHIIPLSSAKTEEDIYKLNHFSNLQPLCSKINRYEKKNKLDYK